MYKIDCEGHAGSETLSQGVITIFYSLISYRLKFKLQRKREQKFERTTPFLDQLLL